MPEQFKFLSVESPWITSPFLYHTKCKHKGHTSQTIVTRHQTETVWMLYVFLYLTQWHVSFSKCFKVVLKRLAWITLNLGCRFSRLGVSASPRLPVSSWEINQSTKWGSLSKMPDSYQHLCMSLLDKTYLLSNKIIIVNSKRLLTHELTY